MESVSVRTNGSGGVNHRVANKPKKIKSGVIAAVVVGTLLLGGLASWLVYQSFGGALVDKSKYQAVFFTNGQVYFGKLEILNGEYYRMNDIFYLQTQSENADSGNPQQTSEDEASDVQLIKLGNEIHGPEDEMIMSKSQVLFFENLKEDGRVSQSISQYKND